MLFSVFGALSLLEVLVLISPWNHYLYALESLWVAVNMYLSYEIGTIEPYRSVRIMVWRKVFAAVFMISFDVWIVITVIKIVPEYCVLKILLSLPIIIFLILVLLAIVFLLSLMKVVAESKTKKTKKIKK